MEDVSRFTKRMFVKSWKTFLDLCTRSFVLEIVGDVSRLTKFFPWNRGRGFSIYQNSFESVTTWSLCSPYFTQKICKHGQQLTTEAQQAFQLHMDRRLNGLFIKHFNKCLYLHNPGTCDAILLLFSYACFGSASKCKGSIPLKQMN